MVQATLESSKPHTFKTLPLLAASTICLHSSLEASGLFGASGLYLSYLYLINSCYMPLSHNNSFLISTRLAAYSVVLTGGGRRLAFSSTIMKAWLACVVGG